MLICAASVNAGAQGMSGSKPPILPVKKVVDGVLILEHDATAFERATQLTIDPIPLTRIDGIKLQPPFDLAYAESGAILSDGRIAVWVGIGARLLIFSRDGKPIHAYGGEGRGPKEIMRARNFVLLPDDQMLLLDGGNYRLSWIDPEKGVVRTQVWESEASAKARMFKQDYFDPLAIVAGVLRDGRIVSYDGHIIRGIVQGAKLNEARRLTAPLLALDLRTLKAERIATLADMDIVFRERMGREKPYMSTDMLGFGRVVHATVWDTMIVTGEGNGYELDFRRSDGQVTARLRSRRARVPVSEQMRKDYVAFMLDRYGAMAINKEENKRMIQTTPFADSLPPYEGLFLSSDSTLWVMDGRPFRDTAWFATGFRADGAILGRLRVSGRSRPLAFTRDRVLLMQEDEEGNVSISVNRLVVR